MKAWFFGVLALVAVSAVQASVYPNPTQEVGMVDAIALGDFNGDGREDAVLGTNLINQDLRIALGTGDGSFGPPTTIQTGSRISKIATADFDRDGRLDIAALAYDQVFGTNTNFRVEVFRGHGDGTFEPPVATAASSANIVMSDMAVGDIDGDGAPDVVTLGSNGFMSLCRLLNSGTGILGAPACQSRAGTSLKIADFNEDGHPDIAILNGGEIDVLSGTGGGPFSGQVVVVTNFIYGLGMMSTADVNGDGHIDILYVPFQAGGVQTSTLGIALGKPPQPFSPPAFQPPISLSVVSCCAGIGAADVDGDGVLDVVTAGSKEVSQVAGITVTPGLAGGGFGPPRMLGSGGGIRSMALGFLNGDARVDIVAGVGLGSNYVSVGGLRSYLGTSDGRFGMISLGAGAGTDAASADLNADGHADLVVVERDNNRISVLLAHGDGTFAPPLRFPCGTAPHGLALGDFNGDGRIDAVTGLTGSLALLYGNGDGTFATPVSIPGGNFHTDVVAGDFNGDGKLDLATADRNDAIVSLFWNIDNAGTFDRSHYPAGYHPFKLAAGDLDGDGVLDLVVGTTPYSGGSIPSDTAPQGLGILHGHPGYFDLPTFLTWPGFTITIADVLVADLNGDGKLDLAAANSDRSGNVTVFFNQGLGTFGAPLQLLAGQSTSPVALAAGDIDGDGRVDLAIGNLASSDIAVFAADGAGGFLPGARFGTLTPAVLLTGDFNEDGRTDFALATPDAVGSVVLRSGAGVGGHDPVADAGPDRTGECGASVLLDGSASSDPDSTPGTNDDIVSFSWYENYGQPSQIGLGSGETLPVVFGLGAHAITLKVTDSTGRTATDGVTITISDTLPPSGSVALVPGVLWPPNHRMVDVTAQVTAADQCGGTVTITLDSVTSSEPDDAPGGADGNTTGDIAGVSPGTLDTQFSLRAERSSTGAGRVYTVSYRLADALGHQAVVSGTVGVPHDRSGVSDPISLQVSSPQPGVALVEWNAIPGADHYDVAAGLLSTLVQLDPTKGAFSPSCVADQVPSYTTSFQVGGDPDPGTAYFFLVDYVSYADATGGRSGYGSDSGPYDLQPVVPVDICP